MPNPFVNPLQKVTSKRPQEHATEPIPEEYAGFNHPYRGVQNHGVEVEYEIEPPIVHGDDTENYEPADKEIPPIPVRVVHEESSERKRVRFAKYTIGVAGSADPVQILARDLKRTKAIITGLRLEGNTDWSIELCPNTSFAETETIRIGDSFSWGTNRLETESQDALYAQNLASSADYLYVQIEYTD